MVGFIAIRTENKTYGFMTKCERKMANVAKFFVCRFMKEVQLSIPVQRAICAFWSYANWSESKTTMKWGVVRHAREQFPPYPSISPISSFIFLLSFQLILYASRMGKLFEQECLLCRLDWYLITVQNLVHLAHSLSCHMIVFVIARSNLSFGSLPFLSSLFLFWPPET